MGVSPGIPGMDATYFVVNEEDEVTDLHFNANLSVSTTHLFEIGCTYVDIEQLRTSFDLLRQRARAAHEGAEGPMAKIAVSGALEMLDLLDEALRALGEIERERMKDCDEHSG